MATAMETEGGAEGPAAKRARTEGGAAVVPAVPEKFLGSTGSSEAFREGMQSVVKALAAKAELRDRAEKPFREARAVLETGMRKMLAGDAQALAECRETVTKVLEDFRPQWTEIRQWSSVGPVVTNYIAMEAFAHFLETGALIGKEAIPGAASFTTNEYLLGTIRFCEELETYAVGRAMFEDVRSVAVAGALIKSILGEFLSFDLRNGPLRRRYDTLKYRNKKLEDMLFELSQVLGPEAIVEVKAAVGSASLVDSEAFAAFGVELTTETEQRDEVIKASREPQQLSKKAIFALHRGDTAKAREMLEKAKAGLVAISGGSKTERGSMNTGAFDGALEEYAEARLFEEWLTADGNLLPLSALTDEVGLDEQGYIGGLVDFTGEIGRLGVAKATVRDVEAAKGVLSTMYSVEEWVTMVQELLPRSMGSKLRAAVTNTKKMQNTMYGLTLAMRSKRKSLELDSTAAEQPAKDAGGDE